MSSQVPAHQPSQDSVWPDDLAVADAVPLPVLFDEEEMLTDDFASPMQHSRDNNWLRETWERIQQLAVEHADEPAEPIMMDLTHDEPVEHFAHNGVVYVR